MPNQFNAQHGQKEEKPRGGAWQSHLKLFSLLTRGCRQIAVRSLSMSLFVVPAKAGTPLSEVKMSAVTEVTGHFDDTPQGRGAASGSRFPPSRERRVRPKAQMQRAKRHCAGPFIFRGQPPAERQPPSPFIVSLSYRERTTLPYARCEHGSGGLEGHPKPRPCRRVLFPLPTLPSKLFPIQLYNSGGPNCAPSTFTPTRNH